MARGLFGASSVFADRIAVCVAALEPFAGERHEAEQATGLRRARIEQRRSTLGSGRMSKPS